MFLGDTQKQQILDELKLLQTTNKYAQINDVITDIENKGVQSKYILLTDPDNQQIAVKVSDDIWIYSEQDSIDYSWEENNDIDIEDYETQILSFHNFKSEELEEAVAGYEDSLDSLKSIYGTGWKQIALECVFEQRMY